MSRIGSLEVDLRTNIAKFAQGMDQANRKMTEFSRSISTAQNIAVGLFTGLAVRQVTAFTKSVVDAADKIGEQSKAIALSAEAFQSLGFAFGQSGAEQEVFMGSMSKFVKSMGEARQGSGALVTFLKDYDQALLNNLRNTTSQEKALYLIADAYKSAKTEQDRAALATAAFGRAGVKMGVAMRDGSEGIKTVVEQAKAAGIIIEEDLIRNADVVNDKFNLLSRTIDANVTRAVVGLSDDIIKLTNHFINLTNNAAAFVDGFKDLENRSNLQGLRKDLTATLSAYGQNQDMLDAIRKGSEQGFMTNPLRAMQDALGTDEQIVANMNRQLEKSYQIIDRIREIESRDMAVARQSQTEGDVDPVKEYGADQAEKEMARKFQVIKESLMSERELLAAHYQENAEIVAKFLEGDQPAIMQQRNEMLLAMEGEYQQAVRSLGNESLDEWLAQQEAMLAAKEDFLKYQVRLEEEAAAAQKVLRDDTFNAATGFLQAMAAQNKKFAKAAIVLSKAVAIAQIQIDFERAKAATLAFYGLTPAGAAAVGKLEFMKGMSMTLVAGTGLAEIANLNKTSGEGAPLGFSSNPVVTQDVSESRSVVPVVEVTLTGAGSPRAYFIELAEKLNEVYKDGYKLRIN